MSKRKDKQRIKEERKQAKIDAETGNIFTAEESEQERLMNEFQRKLRVVYGKGYSNPVDNIGKIELDAARKATEETHEAGMGSDGEKIKIIRPSPIISHELRRIREDNPQYVNRQERA